MYSNSYVFRYAAIMVLLVAAVLSTAALFLKPAQDRNVAVARMQGILAAAHIEATAKDAEELYAESIKEEVVIDHNGDIMSIYRDGKFIQGDVRAFYVDLKKELYNKATGNEYKLPVYIASKNGENIYIIPLLGKGLWGPIYGNIALGDDFNTIKGATFGHDKETPGLGAEIELEFFENQFIGKKILDDNGKFTSVKVIKGGASVLPQHEQIHGVDAISGGTITSNGVSEMLKSNLENYIGYINKHKNL